MPLLSLLSVSFDARKYQGGAGNEGEDKQDDGPWDPFAVETILRSIFSLYCHFALGVDNAPQRLGRWVMGCLCHGHLIEGKGAHYIFKLFTLHFGSASRCPMAGKKGRLR